MLLCLQAWSLGAATLSEPAVDRFNVRVGTQTFAPKYRFSTNTALVETAQAIQGMGSDTIKFYMGGGFSGKYGISLPSSITNLTALAAAEPSCRAVFDMPFAHYLVWAYCFASSNDAWWKDGFSASEQQKEYAEIYGFSRYLLTHYNQSRKSFYLGHWEGDWYLLPDYDTTVNPSPTAIQGMIDWYNIRQKAVDDALRDTPHSNVFVYAYAEANRVRDAMVNPAGSNQRLVNMVLPYATNIDFVSWSSYDGMNLGAADLSATLNYIEAHLPTNKSAQIPGKRVLIGEYGWGGSLSSADQEPPTRAFIQKLLSWSPRFILFWQMYDNEGRAYWLIDSNHVQTPCYFLHQRLIHSARLSAARFQETNSRLPNDAEFSALLSPLLNQPLPAPVSLTVSNSNFVPLDATSARVNGSLVQGIYGDDLATVFVFWGRQNGGPVRGNWEQSANLGLNTSFNPATFSLVLTNLAPKTNYWFRFYATNATGEAWAPASTQITTDVLNPQDFGTRLKIAFPGYTRTEALLNIPLLVVLSTNRAGFSYRQFASRAGGDLRFTDATGAWAIPHEIEDWNTNGFSSVWVRVPQLSGSSDFIWAYWGNPAETTPPAYCTNGAVWSQNFELVWHLKENTFPFADSTRKHPALLGDAPASTAAGFIGRGVLFNGVADYLNAGSVNLGQRFTLSAWVKMDGTANSIQTVWANKGGSAANGLAFFANSWQSRDQKLIFETANGTYGASAATATNLVTFGQWHHVAAAVDRASGRARLLVDGVDRTQGETIRTDFANQTALAFGRFADAQYYFKGTLDEARIETETRSSNWVWATWMTAASNTVFTSYEPVACRAPALTGSARSNGLVLAWPGSGVGFTLYSATNLAVPVNWLPSTNQPLFTNYQWQTLLATSNQSPCFFRLQSSF